MTKRKLAAVRTAAKRPAVARTLHDNITVRDHPDKILDAIRRQGNRMLLGDLFHGDQYASVRKAIKEVGRYQHDKQRKTLHVQTRPIAGTDEHEILGIAAVSRDPGRSETFLDSIQDYQPSGKDRAALVEMYWRIYRNEGIINNAANKLAAALSAGGEFEVTRAKKGKARKATEQLLQILTYWVKNVNSAAVSAVITGARSLPAVTKQVVRQALVEGSWIGRTVWTSAEVPNLGSFDLPMNIQSITTAEIKPVEQLVGTGIELFYWTPPSTLINELEKPSLPEIRKVLQQYVPRDLVTKLKKDRQVLLDPALMAHIKHRGMDTEAFGESFVHAALAAVAYRRSIDQLDTVTMQNLINRLTIVMVGSAKDPRSPYAKPDVAAARAALMQSFFEEPGPNMTIVWSGDDVEVKDVGAHTGVLDLDTRHVIADNKVKIAIGVPDALLSGSSAEGKAAGWAAQLGLAAQIDELQSAIEQAWTTIGERIALENGFTDVEITYKFDRSLGLDQVEERNQARNDYTTGVLSIRSYLKAIGVDPDAEYVQKCLEKGLDPDPETTTWESVFTPPQGLQGQGAGKVPGNGRTPDAVTGKPTPERTPKPTPVENK